MTIGNMTASVGRPEGLFTAVENITHSKATMLSLLGGIALAVFVLLGQITPHVDAQEPPMLKPTIPLIGHIIGLFRHQGQFLRLLNKDGKRPIATLPVLNGKIYAVWDPILIQAAYRNSHLSFIPFASIFAKKMLGFNESIDDIVKNTDLMSRFITVIHPSLSGDNLLKMNRKALAYISGQISERFPDNEWVDIPNFYLWLRNLMTMATCVALYGPGNVFKDRPDLVDDLWKFEGSIYLLVLDMLPSVTAREAVKARNRVQAALAEYYVARLDEHEDVAATTKNRANLMRSYDIPDAEVGKFEIALIHVSVSNSIPTLFWFACHILSRPELVSRLRTEMEDLIQVDDANDKATINIAKFEQKTPLFVRCYKETLRLSNHGMTVRRVVKDTTISDGNGNTYLLKEGVDIQASAGASHFRTQAWGPDVKSFNPDRHLETDKARRAALHPFGGGLHLCPGRNFAYAENLGLVAALVMGFEVEPREPGPKGEWVLPEMSSGTPAEAAVKPVKLGEGFGVRIRRRPGWEKTRWVYDC